MPHSAPDKYAQAGVRTTADAPQFASLKAKIQRTFGFRTGPGQPVLDLGYYANVLQFGDLGIAVTADGVGTKVIVAQQAGDYSGIGIDLIAMNVNDLLCVGADPVALLDYIAIESLEARALTGLTDSLVAGAKESGISIPGGEVAQVGELITSHAPGEGFDIVGTGLGMLSMDNIMVGEAIQPGDQLIGLASTGLHSNGYTLARRLLLSDGWTLDTIPTDLGRSLAAELLEPTRIYVKLFRALWAAEVEMHGAFHMTGEGLLNLLRVPKPMEMVIDSWPELLPVFSLLRDRGNLDVPTLWTTFNMGIGMILAVPQDSVDRSLTLAGEWGYPAQHLGEVQKADTIGLRAPVLGLHSHDNHLRVD